MKLVPLRRCGLFLLPVLSSSDASIFVGESLSKLSCEIVVDGELSDWGGSHFEVLGCNLPFETSFSALFHSGWSEDGLYFAAKVHDEVLHAPAKGSEAFRDQDCLELFVDVRGLDAGIKNPMARFQNMEFDYFLVEDADGSQERIDDGDGRIVYSDIGWRRREGVPGVHLGTVSEVAKGERGASVALSFSGRRISFATSLFARGGLYDVFLNGRKVRTVDLFSLGHSSSRIVFESGLLDEGTHEILVKGVRPSPQGVLHGLISPAEGGGWHFWNHEGRIEEGVTIASGRFSEGWIVEGRISWEALAGFSPSVGKPIRFGYKLYDADGREERNGRTLGLRRHGSGTTVDWMILNPDRFPKATLGEKADPSRADVWAKEFYFQGRSWVELDVKVPAELWKEEVLPSLALRLGGRDVGSFPLGRSAGGRFLFLKRSFPTATWMDEKGGEGPLELAVEVDLLGERLEIDLELLVEEGRRRLESALPGYLMASLSPPVLGMAAMYRESAEELLRHYGHERNRDVEHYHYLPFHEDKATLDRYSDMFIRHAKLWASGRFGSGDALHYYHQPWRSQSDGSWQFFQLELPKEFDPAVRYPIWIRPHFENKRGFSRLNVLARHLEFSEGLLPLQKTSGDGIWIQLHGRGNSFETLGDEEYLHVLDWIGRRFPESAGDVRLRGISVGARSAFLFASRWTDRPSLVYAKGPAIRRPLDPERARSLYGDDNHFRWLTGGFEDKAVNLCNMPLCVIVGEKDRRNLRNAALLHRMVENPQYGYQFDVVPGAGHDIPGRLVPEMAISPKRNGRVPSSFFVTNDSLRYGKAYGVEAEEKTRDWEPFSFKASRQLRFSEWNIQTSNLQAFSMDLGRLGGSVGESVSLSVDGQPLPLAGIDVGEKLYIERRGAQWAVGDRASVEGVLRKRPGLQGPIGDIEKEGFLIVYGTQDPEMEHILFERAKCIVRHRLGSDVGQWSWGIFEVKADAEVTAEDIGRRSLWLIGNERENAVLARMADSLPFGLDDSGARVADRSWRGDSLFLEAICPNPLNPERYVYVEAGQSMKCYYAEILANRSFDFALSEIDLKTNAAVALGVFDADWRLEEGRAKVWDNSD